ncbi:hypothetical protein [Candidatus Enterococcus willemsii]|uniref:Uncharacterized protein n=1 Tax=Candidatus Enterococcus willemsii TaxID=1857215 RepID=A0ABQ6YWW6_9ENTE|nr:hypothetical protein [Enterococcus sp. CU12B]KAF1302198.1 hypothetical protein BAU17_02145 [Enterococcus sp. CU12B]
MGIFTRKTVLEQIDVEPLKADVDTVSRLKKQMTSIQTARKEYESRIQELQESVEKVTNAEETFTTEGMGFKGASAAIQELLKVKREEVDPLEVAQELQYLGQWWHDYAPAKLSEIERELNSLFRKQEEHLRAIEAEFETSSNTEEVDEVAEILLQDITALYEQFLAISRVKDVVTNRETYGSYVNLKLPERRSIAQKEAEAARLKASRVLAAARSQESTNKIAEAQGRETVNNPWLSTNPPI